MKLRPAHAALGLAAAAGIAFVIVGDPLRSPRSAISLQPDDARVLAIGQRVYQAHCAACHGTRLEGQPNWRERGPDGRLPAPPHDATGHTWHHPDEVLFRITQQGVAKVANLRDYPSTMPVYEGVLSDEEIVAALSWIKAQWPPEVRARHDELNRRARD